MPVIFLSLDARQREAWSEAFAEARCARFDAPTIADGQAPVFALLPGGQAPEPWLRHLRKRLGARPRIVLADEPNDDDALAALAAGAAGYCNGHAAPEVLRQVEQVVRHGGVWVGQGLMQRLLGATARLMPAPVSGEAWRPRLSLREQEVAQLLARGSSNKEIARQLEITERTVKAHVSAMLEKLGARDRLQLSLIINGIEKTK